MADQSHFDSCRLPPEAWEPRDITVYAFTNCRHGDHLRAAKKELKRLRLMPYPEEDTGPAIAAVTRFIHWLESRRETHD